jgi:hypothetical protein
MKKTAIATLLALAAASSLGSAKENYHENAFNADTKEKFDDVAASVRKEMTHGGRYEFVKADERKTIDQSLDDMTQLFDQHGSVQAMNQDTKVRLFNDQELVNSILTKRDRDRVICTNQAPIGSHIPVTKCHTYGQEIEAREGTQNQLAGWKSAEPCMSSPSPGNPHPPCYMGPGAGN